MAHCTDLAVEDTDLSTDISREELAELVWAAAEGLPPRDREVMALQLHAGMTATEIAEVLDVSVEHARVLTSRLRQRLEQCLGTLLVARLGRDDCADLSSRLRGWDGTLTVELRNRLGRHIEGCDPCRATRARLAAPSRLLPVTLVLAAPAALRWRTASALGNGVRPSAALTRTSPRRLLVAGLVATVALVAGSLLATDPALPWAGGPGSTSELAPGESGPAAVNPAPVTPEVATPSPAPVVTEPVDPRGPTRRGSSGDTGGPQGSPIVPIGNPVTGGSAPAAAVVPAPVAACGLLADDLSSLDAIVGALPLGAGALLDQVGALGPIASVSDLLHGASNELLGALASIDLCVGADPRPLLDVVAGACPVNQIDLNTAAAPVLAVLPGLTDDGAVGGLLGARPLDSVSELVMATGLSLTEVGDLVASGVGCLGTVPAHLLTSAGPLVALPLPHLLDLSGLQLPLADLTDRLGAVSEPVVPVLTTVLDDVDRVLGGTVRSDQNPLPPAAPVQENRPDGNGGLVDPPPMTVPGTGAPLGDVPPVSVPEVGLPAVTTPAVEIPAVTTPVLDLPAVTVPTIDVGAVVEEVVDTVVVDTVEDVVGGLGSLAG